MKRTSLEDWNLKLEVLLEERQAGEKITDFTSEQCYTAWQLNKTPEEFLRDAARPMSTNLSQEGTATGTHDKTCPFCGETILPVAIKCKHCGSILNEAATRFEGLGKATNIRTNTLLIAILAVTTVGVVLAGVMTIPGWIAERQKRAFEEEHLKTVAQKSTALSRLDQVGQSLEIYVSDYDDTYPAHFGTTRDLKESLLAYSYQSDKGPKAFDDLFSSTNPNGGSFMPNNRLESMPNSMLENLDYVWVIKEEREWPDGETAILERSAFTSFPKHTAKFINDFFMGKLDDNATRIPRSILPNEEQSRP